MMVLLQIVWISKYRTILLLINVLPSWGLEPQLDNADARTHRPPVRMRRLQVRTRRLPISLLIHTACNRSKILNTN